MRSYVLAGLLVCAATVSPAQENGDRIRLSGSVQSDILLPQKDDKIGATKASGDILTNTYAELNATSKHVDAGLRLEYLKNRCPVSRTTSRDGACPTSI